MDEVPPDPLVGLDVEDRPFSIERISELVPDSPEWDRAKARRNRLICKKADAFVTQDAFLTDDENAELAALQSTFGDHARKTRPHRTLAELVAAITPENLHEAWETGPPVGRELL